MGLSSQLGRTASRQIDRSATIILTVFLVACFASIVVAVHVGGLFIDLVLALICWKIWPKLLLVSDSIASELGLDKTQGQTILEAEDYLRQLSELRKVATADATVDWADHNSIREKYRQCDIWREQWLQLDQQRKQSLSLSRLVPKLGLLDAIILWNRNRHIASQLLDEAGQAILLKQIGLKKALLVIGDAEITAKVLRDELADYFRVKGPLVDAKANAIVQSRIAYVEAPVPADTVARTIREVKQTKKGPVVTERPRPPREINREYRDEVTEFARGAVQRVFQSAPALERTALSLFAPMMHETLGHNYRGCVLAVLADRQTWERIVHGNVAPENALRNFDFRFHPDPERGLLEVPAIRAPSEQPQNETIFLQQIDPIELERLVANLLTRMGYISQLTKASHDGGIDVVAVNPQPLIGGKVVVQCKRYSGVVGSPIVRDLYGVVHSEQATKGILITTSDFSPDAYSFAEGKPLELINGSKLTDLLRQNGFSVN